MVAALGATEKNNYLRALRIQGKWVVDYHAIYIIIGPPTCRPIMRPRKDDRVPIAPLIITYYVESQIFLFLWSHTAKINQK